MTGSLTGAAGVPADYGSGPRGVLTTLESRLGQPLATRDARSPSHASLRACSTWKERAEKRSVPNRSINQSINFLSYLKRLLQWRFDCHSASIRLRRKMNILITVRRYAVHGLWDGNSVCPSVCLSVCPSHSWTVSTWFDLRS